jgi:RNA polymerase sigma-70 factor (ECF subfamily)
MNPHAQSVPDDASTRVTPTLDSWLRAAARGDEAAFSKIYQATSSRVFGLALKILRDRAAAEDVTCEVFTQLWRKSADFDPVKGSSVSWILTMARTRAIDRLRSAGRLASREGAIDAAWEVQAPGADPEQQNLDEERAKFVRKALAALPAEQREAITVSFFGGLSHSETAEALGAPLGTVKTRIRAGLSGLRRELAGSEGTLA